MQIWRMRNDCPENPKTKEDKACGTAERITNDQKWNDWFPHFSPDGKWITIISYGLEVEASNHPYYKHCMIRIMPADGSAPPKMIAYVYGGQGTINVPSWSPDGTHVAFVSQLRLALRLIGNVGTRLISFAKGRDLTGPAFFISPAGLRSRPAFPAARG